MADESKLGRVIIAGGSGFLGVSLATHLAGRGWSVVILSRQPPKVCGPWRHVKWDARSLGDWTGEIDGASGLINLVGRNVDCIKTADHQDEILRSRVEATRVLGLAVRSIESPPPVWVQMSTAHTSRRLQVEGFEFQFPELSRALNDLCAPLENHLECTETVA